MKKLKLVAMLFAMASGPVAAAPITGAFSGSGSGRYGSFDPRNTGTFTNVPATGSFSIDANGCKPDPYSGFCIGVQFTLSADFANGRSTSFGIHYNPGTAAAMLTSTAGGQKLDISFGYQDGYNAGTLTLFGGPSAFTDGTDVRSLHGGATVGGVFNYMESRDFASQVGLGPVTLQGDVPEPRGVAVFAAGLAWFSRGRRAGSTPG